MTVPRRRCLRFSLRTLLVLVTVLGAFLGWFVSEWRFVRDRRQSQATLSEKAGETGYALPYPGSMVANWPEPMPDSAEAPLQPPTVPLWRQWLGDEPFGLVVVPDTWPKNEVLKVRSLFPESFVYWRGEFLRP